MKKASEPTAAAPTRHATPARPFFTPPTPTPFFAPAAKASSDAVQAKLEVSKPGDALEREADRAADHVMRTPAPTAEAGAVAPTAGGTTVLRAATAAPGQSMPVASGPTGAPSAPPPARPLPGAIAAGASAGRPLPEDVRAFMEPRFDADFGGVRVHTDDAAGRASIRLGARAFTTGGNIFFAPGQFQPGTADGRQLIAHELTHTVQQGRAGRRTPTVQRSPMVTTNAATPDIQRLGVQDILDYFADKARYIPGYTMLTFVLGFNPVNQRRVERTPANLLRAVIELVPGGPLLTQALDNHGVVDRAAAWITQKLATLGDIGGDIVAGLRRFIDSLSWTDIFSPGDVWDRAKRIFSDPIGRLIGFGASTVGEILKMIKDAILRPLAALAEGTRGYDLLKALLGQDPVTGDPVPRTPDTLIGGFMKLIGQEEVWQNLKRGNAVPRAWAWFQGALQGLLGFAREIPRTIVATLQSLTVQDVLTVVGAFRKVASAFIDIAGRFISWALNQVLSLLEILFSVVAPGVMPYVAKAKAAFHTIVRDPVRFIRNLVAAGKLGFQQFAKNILTHLKEALIRWLTGPLGEAGVYIPKSFALLEIVKLVLSVLGLTWQNIRSKLVKIIPDPVLTVLEKTAGVLVTLVTQGPAAAWEQIKGELNELKDQLIGQVTQMITTEVVKAAVMKLVSMLNPAGAVIQAIIATYNTVTFFIEKIQQIAAVVASFIDSISAIAAGQVQGAANRVEQTMARSLTVVIAFLAKFVGLGNVPTKLVDVVKKIRQPIDRGLDKIVTWLGSILQRIGGAVKAGVRRLLEWWKKKVPVNAAGESHVLTFDGKGRSARLVIRSAPMKPSEFLQEAAAKYPVPAQEPPKERSDAVTVARTTEGEIVPLQAALAAADEKAERATTSEAPDKTMGLLDGKLQALAAHVIKYLEKWSGAAQDKVSGLVIPRGSFSLDQKYAIKAEAKRMGAQEKDFVLNSKGHPVNLRPDLKFARRHVVSAHDIGDHYMKKTNGKKVSEAKLLLEERSSIPLARTKVDALTSAAVVAAAHKRYDAFFGYAKNIFVNDKYRNSALQEQLDPDHPEMQIDGALDDHVRRVKREWAIDSEFKPTPTKSS